MKRFASEHRSTSQPLVGLLLVVALNAITPVAGAVIRVAPDGTGDFKSIQAAVNAVPNGNTNATVIRISPGRYEERVFIQRGMDFITMLGTGRSREDVIITGGKAKVAVLKASANDFRAENFTVENTAGPTAGPQQALYSDGKRQIFENLLIKGWQDTLGAWNGNVAYYNRCEIWGSVDFIYSGGTAVFDQCDIVQIRDVGGPVAAPSTPKDVKFGLVFLNCHLIKGPGVKVGSSSLMRPWFPDGHTAFINCMMDDHISAKGCSEWDGRENTCSAVEVGSQNPDGTLVDLSQRASWVKVLTPAQAEEYSLTNVLGGWDPVVAKKGPKARQFGAAGEGRTLD